MTESWKNKRRNPGKGRFRCCGFNLTSDLTAWAREREIQTKPQHGSRVRRRLRRPRRPESAYGWEKPGGRWFTNSFRPESWKIPIIPPNPRVFWDEGDASRRQGRAAGPASSRASAFGVLTQFAGGGALPEGVFLGHGGVAPLSRRFLEADSPVSVPLPI